jgi:hypothetical protein
MPRGQRQAKCNLIGAQGQAAAVGIGRPLSGLRHQAQIGALPRRVGGLGALRADGQQSDQPFQSCSSICFQAASSVSLLRSTSRLSFHLRPVSADWPLVHVHPDPSFARRWMGDGCCPSAQVLKDQWPYQVDSAYRDSRVRSGPRERAPHGQGGSVMVPVESRSADRRFQPAAGHLIRPLGEIPRPGPPTARAISPA